MAEAEHESPWVTITEAANRTGRHIDAVRAAVRRGRLEARKNNAGQWLVRMPKAGDSSLSQAASVFALGKDSAIAEPAPGSDSGMADSAVRDALDRLEALHRELADARVAFAQALAERDAARAVAIADIATAEAKVSAREEIIGELRAELERARRPFWRRWLG